MKSIVLNGATSMLGIALIKECLKFNTKVAAIVRPNSANMHRLPKNDLIEVVECENNDLHKLPGLICGKYDCFYHFSWDGTSREWRDDVFIHENNIANTLKAAKAAHQLGCEAFVGAGSQAEYGRVSDIISPDTNANPEYAYGIAKLAAGNLSRQYCGENGMRFAWGRIFSVYGEYDHSNTMIMYLIRTLLEGKKPSLTKCEQMWDYLYCGDAADAFYRIGECGSGFYCIGSGKMRPLFEYVKTIRNLINSNAELGIGEKEYAQNQVMKLCADIRNLQRDTGFIATTDFAAGIQKTIYWYKEEIGL